MNNRIMAMLCALVAAMFLSIVPVKAEAAESLACRYGYHSDTTEVAAKAATCAEAGNVAYYKCNDCGTMFEDIDCKRVIESGDQIIPKADHDMQWEITETTHKHACKNCGYAVDFGTELYVENHNFTYKDNGDGTHTATCKVCGYEKTEDHAEGKTKDCKCYLCDAELEHTASDWRVYPSDNSKHIKQCTVCSKTLETAEHNYTYEYTNPNYHKATCKDCGYVLEKLIHVDENSDCKCDQCGEELTHDTSKMEWIDRVEPTCTKDGVKGHYECEKCHKIFDWNGKEVTESIVLPATGHQANGKWENDEDGFHYQWCAHKCGTKLEKEDHVAGEWKLYNSDNSKHFKQCTVCSKTLEKAEHDYTYEKVNETYHQPVCKACGHKADGEFHVDEDSNCVCDLCGAELPHTIDDLTKVERVEPTCEKEGNKGYLKCEHCGKVFNLVGTEITKEDIVIPATGHDWKYIKFNGDKHLVKCKNDNCDLDGQATIIDHEDTDGDCKCDLNGCGQLVHSHKKIYTFPKDPTCTEAGCEAYYVYEGCGKMFDLDDNAIDAPVAIPAAGHDDGGDWEIGDNGKHVKKCTKCGEVIAEEDHVFANGNIKCTVCGAEENLEHVDAVAATCGKAGNVEYWVSKTGAAYADKHGTQPLTSFVIPALGHDYVAGEDNGDGKTHAYICMNCGDEKTQNHNTEGGCYCSDCGGNLAGHEVTFVPQQEATCEKAGHEAYFTCSCGKIYDMGHNVIEAPVAIAKLAHTTNGKVYKDTKEGKHYTECTTCGKKFYEEHVMEVEDPMKGNYHQYVCECGELKVEQHYDKDGDGVCDVCDHSMSSSSVTVEQHDSVTVKTGDASTINKHYTWWRNWLEALFPSNSGGTVASAQKTEETSAASSQTVAPATNSASQNTNQNTTASSGTTAGETVVNTNALTQFVSWFLGLFGF